MLELHYSVRCARISFTTCCQSGLWSYFLFLVSSFFFGAVRYIKLALCQILNVGKYTISYRVVSQKDESFQTIWLKAPFHLT